MNDIDICNVGLSLIGATAIASFDESSTEAAWCKTNYLLIRDTMLSEHAWRWAEKQVVLTDPVPSPWGDGFLYPLPEETAHVFRCYQTPNQDGEQANWRRMGLDVWAAHEGAVYALIMPTDITEANMPPLFVTVLANRLAVEMSIPLTRSAKLQASLVATYGEKLARAVSVDSAEGRSERLRVSGPLATARFTGVT